MCAHHSPELAPELVPDASPAPSAPSAPATAVDHVGVSVSDLDRSVSFYREAFGLREEFRFAVASAGPMTAVVLRSPDGWAVELLHRPDSREPSSRHLDPDAAVLSRGYGHLCVRVHELDETYARLLAAGASVVVPPSPSPHPAVRYAYTADPEGNLVELIHVDPAGLGTPA